MDASVRIWPCPALCQRSVSSFWFLQSPQPSEVKSPAAPKYTPPQDRLAEMPASRQSWAMVPVCMYMSAMQVTPEAIISASPSPAPARTARSSSLASAGKIQSLSHVWRSWPPPYPRMRVMGTWVWALTKPGSMTRLVQSMTSSNSPAGRSGPA